KGYAVNRELHSAGAGARAGQNRADRGGEGDGLAEDRGAARGGNGGGRAGLIDGLGQHIGRAAVEVGIAIIDEGDGVGGDGEQGVGVSGLAAAQSVRAQGGSAVLEDDRAGGRADAGRSGGDARGKDHGLAEHGRVGGRGEGRGGV